jgi:hypothetical protein
MAKKVKVTERLRERTKEVFFQKDIIYTGELGLTRQELRALERAGMVESLMVNHVGKQRLAWRLSKNAKFN